MEISGVTKLRKVGNALGLTLHKNIFSKFDGKEGDSLIIYYDEENKSIIIKKGGMK